MIQTFAIVNEKGGTGKTTTTVNLSAALGALGKKVLLVDLDGQAASSRWLGVEEDTSFADALWRGEGLTPIPDVAPGVSLAPGSGKLDSVAHDLRPTQGGQLRKVLAQVTGFDYILIDCPPSLGNRLIGNALLAATHAIVPVETSILALDGLKILLSTLQDIRDGFDHQIELLGVLACRYDARTRLSRMILTELQRALPGRVFDTVIRENVRMRECPGSGRSILAYAPDSHAAEDYRALAVEVARRAAQVVGAEGARGEQNVGQLRQQVDAMLRKLASDAMDSGEHARHTPAAREPAMVEVDGGAPVEPSNAPSGDAMNVTPVDAATITPAEAQDANSAPATEEALKVPASLSGGELDEGAAQQATPAVAAEGERLDPLTELLRFAAQRQAEKPAEPEPAPVVSAAGPANKPNLLDQFQAVPANELGPGHADASAPSAAPVAQPDFGTPLAPVEPAAHDEPTSQSEPAERVEPELQTGPNPEPTAAQLPPAELVADQPVEPAQVLPETRPAVPVAPTAPPAEPDFPALKAMLQRANAGEAQHPAEVKKDGKDSMWRRMFRRGA